ncbi:ArsR/SmtB family transcription factor [Mesorhizobium sp. BR1-1-2]|uniref:ArsR/SmtB family transcription factor n=1 Tax=Mesorhizobium sp. BR1-1-2 TaxID=2876652 RepID=UPI001CCF6697|nr:metalloregulator ArsR/SmtB family transcription factor [Mesorhizobium sp. BR1-1-2]MBZ9967738.1 metalloregulator ArsR/SmtB family transcription factor [Mesorhizobium sp. BR1-1-2]
MIEAEIFRALADPTRRAVYERLATSEMTVSQLRTGMTVSQPAVSQHLAVLRGAGLVVERRAGRNAYYRADPKGLDPLLGWIERYRTFWPERIERLKTVLKDMDQ